MTAHSFHSGDVPDTQHARHVDVIVPVKNGADAVGALIERLQQQSLPRGVNANWYFVDDASTDATRDVLRRMSDPRLTVIPLPEHLGRAAARNAGVAAGRGELLLLLDADCVPGANLIREHLAVIESGADVSFGRVTGMGEGFWAAYQSRVARERAGKAEVGDYLAMTTANAMMRRNAFEQAGGYDEAYKHYGFEDRDLVHRLIGMGARAGYSDQAMVQHRLPPDLWRMCDHMFESGVFTAARFRARFPESYRKSAFARFDRTCTGRTARVFLDAAAPRRDILLRITAPLVRRPRLPFELQLFLVRLCVGLSYYAGTMQTTGAESGA